MMTNYNDYRYAERVVVLLANQARAGTIELTLMKFNRKIKINHK